jgi:hypothetical protein
MRNRILPEFQDFLLSRSLAPAKNTPFYAHWVSKFLVFSNKNQDLGLDLRVEKFLNQLKSQKKIADWQVKQADEAVRLYIHHFLDDKTSVLSPNVPQERFPDTSRILGKMREAIRIKHYSYRTERSYLEWVERFIDYTSKAKKERCSPCWLRLG